MINEYVMLCHPPMRNEGSHIFKFWDSSPTVQNDTLLRSLFIAMTRATPFVHKNNTHKHYTTYQAFIKSKTSQELKN